MNVEHRENLTDLLLAASHSHGEAFAATNGADPDWAIWYADYLQAPLAENLGMSFHKSRLIYCLMDADFEHRTRAPESEWPRYYADLLIERYGESAGPAKDKLALYHFNGCPFCAIVRSAIDRLGIEVELRDIFQDRQHRTDLIAARARATVPVLRIATSDGEERWMPESRDIVRYLEATYG